MKGLLHAVIDPPIPALVLLLLLGLLLVGRRMRTAHLIAVLASSLVALSLAEVFCRVTNLGGFELAVWEEPYARGEAYPYMPHGQLVYRYPSNPRGYFDENNEVIGRINSAGFRGHETTMRKPPGVIRVAFLGDSFCLGIGVKDDHTLPARFEAAMRKTQVDVEALNFGKSATSTDQQIDLLRDYVLQFDPDVVIVVMFLNDADRIMTIKFLSRPVILARVRKHSQFLNATFLAIERPLLERAMVRHYHQGYTDDSEGWSSIVTALQAGKRLSEEHNIQFVVTVYPVLIHLDSRRYPFTEIHHKIGRRCESMGIPLVDLLPAFLGETDYEMWVHPTDQHPNEIAQAIAGSHLADSLRNQLPFNSNGLEAREVALDRASGNPRRESTADRGASAAEAESR